MVPPPPSISDSHASIANGVWPSGVQHAIEDRHADSGFGALAGQAACPETGADDRLVTPHCRLDERALTVAGFLLPTQPSFLRHQGNVLIPLRGTMGGGGAKERSKNNMRKFIVEHLRRNGVVPFWQD